MKGPGGLNGILLLLAGGVLLPGQGCSTQGVAIQEYDSLLLPPAKASSFEPLRYGDRSLRYPWLYRQFEGTGIDWFFVNLFGIDPGPFRVRRPLDFARRRLQVMGEARTPKEIEEAALRLMLAALQDPWRLNRMTALQSLENVALRIGPGGPPPPGVSKEPPRPPSLDRAFRARLKQERAGGGWKSLQDAVRKTFLSALTDPREEVRVQALQGTYDLWGVKGLRTAILVHDRWGPPVWSPNLIRKAAYLCQGALPEEARDRRDGPSLFDILHDWVTKLPVPELVMNCRKAVSSILGGPPVYDTSFFEKWWEEETGALHRSSGEKGRKGS